MLPIPGKPFWPVWRKNSAAEKKIRPLSKFDLCRLLVRLKFCYLCLRAWEKCNISLICTKLERTRGEKLIFKKCGPFSALFYTKSAKICPAALLLFGPGNTLKMPIQLYHSVNLLCRKQFGQKSQSTERTLFLLMKYVLYDSAICHLRFHS